MHAASKVFGRFEPTLNERLIDDHLRSDIRQFTFLPGFDLFSDRFKVSLHSVDAHCDAIDERERLRVFSEHGRKHAWDKVANLTENMVAGGRDLPPTTAFSGLHYAVGSTT